MYNVYYINCCKLEIHFIIIVINNKFCSWRVINIMALVRHSGQRTIAVEGYNIFLPFFLTLIIDNY